MRWIASMVAPMYIDILNRGGINVYPADKRSPDAKTDEAAPDVRSQSVAAFIVEQAGGAATNGEKRILDIQPKSLHERVAVFLGSKNEVDRVTRYHFEAKK